METWEPLCPRCGYDQSGAVAAWERAASPTCPVEGTCSECGLGFLWRDVLIPGWCQVPWLYEHRREQTLGATWKTWRRAVVPPRFWGEVPLTAPIRPRRIVLWAVALLLPIQLLISVIALGDRCVYTIGSVFPTMGPAGSGVGWSLRPLTEWLDPRGLLTLASAATAPWLDCTIGMAAWANRLPRPYVLDAGLAMSALIPLQLLLLARTRKDSRVRRGHVLRAAVYGLAWLVPVLGVCLVAAALDLLATWRSFGGEWFWQYPVSKAVSWTLGHHRAPPCLLALVAAWIGWWWHEAIVRGFRFDRGRLVWSLLMVGAVLLGTAVAIASSDFREWLLAR